MRHFDIVIVSKSKSKSHITKHSLNNFSMAKTHKPTMVKALLNTLINAFLVGLTFESYPFLYEDHSKGKLCYIHALSLSSIILSKNGAEKEIEEDPTRLKQFILSKLGKVSEKIKEVFERTELNNMICAPLRFRHPWELLWRNIDKDNICVAGDALHPMTPDLGQGGCAALEDSIVLARNLAEALKENDRKQEGDEDKRIEEGLEKFARERRWRNFDLISVSYLVGLLQQSDGVLMNFVRDKMAKHLAGILLKKACFDCGTLIVS